MKKKTRIVGCRVVVARVPKPLFWEGLASRMALFRSFFSISLGGRREYHSRGCESYETQQGPEEEIKTVDWQAC